ncbi:hypothetical protein [Methylocystis sp. S23]
MPEAILADTPAAELKGLAKLKAFKEKAVAAGEISHVLPDSGVTITLPAFKPNAAWMKAQAMGDGDADRARRIYIVTLCRFDGERLTLDEYSDLISATDHLACVAKVFESEEDRQKATGKK